MTRPRIAGVADDEVAAAAEQRQRDAARARANRTSARSSNSVVRHREQVGRAADAHRGEPRERLVARGLDADAALDVRPESPTRRTAAGRRASRRHSARDPARVGARSSAGVGQRPALGERRAPAPRRRRGARAGARRRAAAAIARVRPGRRGWRRDAEERVAVEVVVRGSASAAPASTSSRAFAFWWPPACGYGTTTIGRPRADASASVEEPARPRAGPRPPAPSPCRRAGTGTDGSARARPPAAPRGGERGGVAGLAGDVDDVRRAPPVAAARRRPPR